jgi:GH25 family lysozyme M1 (1,4-beta-N-acetylmuramidase)
VPLFGVDVTHHQRDFGWREYAADGHRFGIIKATEGQGFVSPTFSRYRQAMADEAFVFKGFYHFARPDTGGGTPADARAEAADFLAAVGSLSTGDGLALDYEPNEGLLSKEAHEDWCIAFIDAVEKAKPEMVGRILFYSFFKLVAFMSTDRLVKRCPLWVAAYGPNDGEQHASALSLTSFPGRVDRWEQPTLWQFTSKGRVKGFDGNVDVNRFEGDEGALAALGKQ